jgi:cytosine/adenosine deaminase-related metal-dependent hydrolase
VLLKKDKLYPLKKDRILSNIVYYSVGEHVGKVIVNGRIVYDENVEREFDKRRRELLGLLDKIIP